MHTLVHMHVPDGIVLKIILSWVRVPPDRYTVSVTVLFASMASSMTCGPVEVDVKENMPSGLSLLRIVTLTTDEVGSIAWLASVTSVSVT